MYHFFHKRGTLIIAFFCITIIDGRLAVPSLCLRFAFALKVEKKCIQNGRKHPSTLPIHLLDELFFHRAVVFLPFARLYSE